MRGRGLKHPMEVKRSKVILSPPMRGRGLKHTGFEESLMLAQSPPMRGRGLKHDVNVLVSPKSSRPPCGGVD